MHVVPMPPLGGLQNQDNLIEHFIHTMSLDLLVDQPSLPGLCPVTEAVQRLSHGSASEERGAVFTRPEVVEFMLDLAGYTPDRDLSALRLLEPSFGSGEFLVAAIERLVASWRRHGAETDLTPCIHAVELHRDTHEQTLKLVHGCLERLGLDFATAHRLANAWLRHGDFLLSSVPGPFDVVIGNPPYVRQELIPAPLLREYRRRYKTLYDRADLYVPFIERSLDLLAPGGQLAFICADRWTKNKYGGPLRAKVFEGFHLRAYVDMVDTAAFDAEVSAYPAITLIQRNGTGPTLVADRPELNPHSLQQLAQGLRGEHPECPGVRVIEHAVNGAQPWLLDAADKLSVLRRLEATLPTLEEAGCKVGIGVATGADKAFIGPFDELDVEPSRKLRLATTKDIRSGRVAWTGLGVVNPFDDHGGLVRLADYPKLAAYLEARKQIISRRHVAQRAPDRWYRTIDRITPSLARAAKLLIPDIKGQAQVVYEPGELYPHHNLYHVLSSDWDLHALQAVLLSCVAREFVRTYSTTMRGGYLRFQAQYLRRIRVPHWNAVPEALRERLMDAAKRLDVSACDALAAQLYGLTDDELGLLQTL